MIVRKRQTKLIASLLAVSLIAACAPKVKSKQYPESRLQFTTTQQDTKLALRDVSPDELLKHLSADQQMKTGELFKSVGGLYSLADQHQNPALKTLADGITNQFYTSLNTTAKVRLEQSPLIQAALGYGQNYLDLSTQLLSLIENSSKTYKWPKEVKFENYQAESQKFVAWLLAEARVILATKAINLTDEQIAEAEEQVTELLAQRQQGIQESVDGIKAADSAVTALSSVSDFLEQLFISLEDENFAELSKLLATANEAAVEIDQVKNKATSEKALKAAKKVLSEETLNSIDKAAAPEQLKLALVQALSNEVLTQVELASATKSFPNLGNQLLAFAAGLAGLDVANLKEIAADPKAGLKKLAAQLGESHLVTAPAGFTGVESDEIDVVFQSNNLKISGKKSKEMKTSAEAIGASLSNSIAKVVETDKAIAALNSEENAEQAEALQKENKTLVMSQLNKLILLSGFRTEDNKVASYTTVQDGSSQPVELLNDSSTSKVVSAVPDDVTIARNLTPVTTNRVISVRGQAALLQGLSDTISYLRDWKKNGFEQGLGKLTIGEMLGADMSSVVVGEEILKKPVFDKSLLFTVAIGNAATILKNIKKELTPFYLVSPTESSVWLNEQPRNAEGKVSDTRATAGIVDIVNGRRTAITKTGDVARYILAVTSFLDATNGIEKTKSALLKKVDEKTGLSKLDELVAARTDLRMLLTALSNMLSGTLQQPDGSFGAQFNKTTRKVSGKASAVDTALAIEALTKVATEFEALVYSDAALEGYFAMNRTMWNKETQFYNREVGKNQAPSYHELVSILNSVNTLAPHLPSDSKAQWNAITKNWVNTLELLANNLEAAKK